MLVRGRAAEADFTSSACSCFCPADQPHCLCSHRVTLPVVLSRLYMARIAVNKVIPLRYTTTTYRFAYFLIVGALYFLPQQSPCRPSADRPRGALLTQALTRLPLPVTCSPTAPPAVVFSSYLVQGRGSPGIHSYSSPDIGALEAQICCGHPITSEQ